MSCTRLHLARLVITTVSLTVLLAACSHQPPRVDTSYLTAWQPDVPAQVQLGDASELAAWWQQWHDETLNQVLILVLAQNPSLGSAGISYQIARVQAGAATSSLRPKGSVSFGAGETFTENDSSTSVSAGLNASWELDLWGKRQAYQAKADANSSRALENLHAAQISLIAQTVQSYLSLRLAQLQRKLALQSVELSQQNYDMQQWLQNAGLATDIEVAKALASLRQTEATVPSYEKTIHSALQELKSLAGGQLGELDARLRQTDTISLPHESVLRVTLNAELLRQRPDVKAQEWAIIEQNEALFLAERARYPSFSLTGSISSSSQDVGDLFSAQSIVSRIAANLAYVLFDGGSLKQAEEVQRWQLRKSLLDYQNTLLTAQKEVEGALTALDVSQRRRHSYQQALESTVLSASLADIQHQAGLIGLEDVISAKAALVNSQSALLVNQLDVLTGWVQLYRSLGGGWQGLSFPVTAQPAVEE